MDRLASRPSLSPAEVRLRNSMQTGDRLITGQVVEGMAPVAELIRTCSAAPVPAMDPSPSFLAFVTRRSSMSTWIAAWRAWWRSRRHRMSIEQPEPGAPFGAKGVDEAPTISSSTAVAAAIHDVTGLDLTRIPIKPEDIALQQLVR